MSDSDSRGLFRLQRGRHVQGSPPGDLDTCTMAVFVKVHSPLSRPYVIGGRSKRSLDVQVSVSDLTQRFYLTHPYSILEEHCKLHMAEGIPSVFDSVRQVQAIASTIAFNQPQSATICWNKAQDVLQYKKFQVKIFSLTSGVQRMLEDLLLKMHGLTGGTPVKYAIPKDQVDDLSSSRRGYSWLQGCDTEPRDQGLMHAMVERGLWNLSLLNEKGELGWNRVACQRFMAQTAEMVDLIITLVHLGSGPPLRGEELIRDQISNGIQPRTIYLVFGQMMAIRRRSKDTNARGIDSFNACYFPKSLTDAICYYLVVIRPLEKVIAWQLYRDPKSCTEYEIYLYVKHGKRLTSSEFSETLSKLTGEYMGVKLSIQPLRHVMIAFQRAFVEPTVVNKGNNVGDLISSHSSKTADRYYAREYDDLEGATSSYLLDVQEWCDLYHEAIGLGERKGPLVPLRTKRKVARQLVTLASMDSADPLAVNVLTDVFKQVGETAYRSGLQELKSHTTKEIWEAVSNGLEQTISDSGLFSGLALPSSGPDPPLRPLQSSHPPTPAGSSNPPTRSLRPAHSETSAPANSAPPVGTSGRKRMLSISTDPAAKRKQTSVGTFLRPQDPTAEDADSPFGDSPGGRVSDHPEAASEPALDHSSGTTVTLPSQSQNDLFPEGETVRMLSRLSIEPDHQPSSLSIRPTPSFGSPSEDKLLSALRSYRRDPAAQFKSVYQRKLLESVTARNYTIGILPTGSGKSIAYELPPTYQGQVTIVAIPYKAIISQALQTAKSRGVAAEVWRVNDTRNVENLRLVIVPYDSLLTEEFRG